jgi:hypothetical protein
MSARDLAAQRRAAEARLHRQRQVKRLGGRRPLFELLDELARHHPEIAPDIWRRLDRIADYDQRKLRRFGGDRFPPAPLWRVPR